MVILSPRKRNRFHGILIINPLSVGTGRDLSLQKKIKPLSELIGALKQHRQNKFINSDCMNLNGSVHFMTILSVMKNHYIKFGNTFLIIRLIGTLTKTIQ
jgi:hypothetical protein